MQHFSETILASTKSFRVSRGRVLNRQGLGLNRHIQFLEKLTADIETPKIVSLSIQGPIGHTHEGYDHSNERKGQI